MVKSFARSFSQPEPRLKALQESFVSSANRFRKSVHLRKERFPSTTVPFAVSLLQHVQIIFPKAIVPNKQFGTPQYVMRVRNTVLDQSWEINHPFAEFYEFKQKILKELQHGHLCSSKCPYLYDFVSHHFPRRHIFRTRRASVIAARCSQLREFMLAILTAVNENQDRQCPILSNTIARILYDFLHQNMVFNSSDFEHTRLKDRLSFHSSGITIEPLHMSQPCSNASVKCDLRSDPLDCSRMESCPDACGICRAPLTCFSYLDRCSQESDANTALTMVSNEQPTRHSALITAITTLKCGHRFHDECILEELNHKLQCPVCDTVPF